MKRTVAILLSSIATLLMLASCGPSWSCVRSGDITDDGSICWKLELHYDKDEFEKPVAQVIGRLVLEDRVSDHSAIHENLLTVCWDSLLSKSSPPLSEGAGGRLLHLITFFPFWIICRMKE